MSLGHMNGRILYYLDLLTEKVVKQGHTGDCIQGQS